MDSSTPSPSVSFRLLPDDITAFRRQLGGVGSSQQRVIVMAFVFFAAILVAGVVFKAQLPVARVVAPSVARGPSYSSLVSTVLPFVLLTVFWFLILRSKLGINTKVPILQHPNEVTLGPDAFSISYGATATAVRWEGIEKVLGTPTHLFVFTLPQDGFVVPRRAFNSDAEFTAFGDFAQRKWAESRPQTPPIARV